MRLFGRSTVTPLSKSPAEATAEWLVEVLGENPVMEDVSELAPPHSVTVQDPDGQVWSLRASVAP